MPVNLSYRMIANDQQLLEYFFLQRIIDALDKKSVYVYGAIDGKSRKMVGACLFSILNNHTKVALMHYCTVIDDYTGKKIGSMLIKAAAEALRKAGAKYIVYRELADSPRELLSSVRFAMNNEFYPGTPDELLMYYDSAKLLSRLSRLEKGIRSSGVETIKDPGDERIRHFNEKNTDTLFKIKAKEYDPNYTAFYIENGEICGACIVNTEKNTALINDIYVSPGLNEVNAYTELLCFSMIRILRDPAIEDICIQVVGEERVQEIIRVLGPERESYQAIEMVRYL